MYGGSRINDLSDFLSDVDFFVAFGDGRILRQGVPDQAGQLACENLHIDHARNAADAAAPRMVFWSVLFVGDEYRRI